MRAKQDDADRRVPCSRMLGGICRIHFNLMFAARMTALYFSVSAAM